MKTSINFIVAVSILTAVAFTSCKKDDLNPAPGNSNGTTMKVRMTDAPADYASLNVEITQVEVYLEDSGWITLNNQAQMISVLDLNNGIYAELTADVPVSAGLYTDVRITFGNNHTLAFNSGADVSGLNLNAQGMLDLQLGSAQQVVVHIDQNVSAGAQIVVSLDFNAAQSIVTAANTYVLQPVIHEVDETEGEISGQIQAGADAAIIVTNGIFTASTYANASGQFMASGIPNGTYIVTILPTPEEVIAGMPQQYTINQVVVANGQLTSLGNIQLN